VNTPRTYTHLRETLWFSKLFDLHRHGHAKSIGIMSIEALVSIGFGQSRDEELQIVGGELRNFGLAGVGMRVLYYGRVFMEENGAAGKIYQINCVAGQTFLNPDG